MPPVVKNDCLLLREADETLVPQLGRCATFAMRVFARLPILHSVAWLSVVGFAAAHPHRVKLLEMVIEVWLLYSFTKYVVTGCSALIGLKRLQESDALAVDWWAADANKKSDAAERAVFRENALFPSLRYDDVVHVVTIPNYKEDVDTLRRTLGTLAAQRDARRAMVVVLAMEARDPNARETLKTLQLELGGKFLALHGTLHALRSGEVGGKSSNENWAVRCAKRRLVEEESVRSERVVVTVCDADTYFHTSHFAALTWAYVAADPLARRRLFWQACTQFYPNSDEVPTLCAVRYALLSVGFLGQLNNPFHFRLPFAVYSLSLDLVVEANYWDPSVIPEDWHMFLRCFYATSGAARVETLRVSVGCECVTDATPLATVLACYEQAKRWQWGAIDMGFIAVHTQRLVRDCKAREQLVVALAAAEHHLYYPLMWIVVAMAPWLFEGWAKGWRFRLWAGFYLSNFLFLNYLDAQYRAYLAKGNNGAGGEGAEKLAKFSLQRVCAFILFPVADMVLFVLPSLHAHARMALSTRFDYVVAPKIRSRVGTPLGTPTATPAGTPKAFHETAPLVLHETAVQPQPHAPSTKLDYGALELRIQPLAVAAIC